MKVKHCFSSWRPRRHWRALVCALALSLAALPALAAAQPLTGTFAGTDIGREVAFSHAGQSRNEWAGVLKLKLDSGEVLPVFCIEVGVRVRSGDRYRSDGSVLALPNGCKIRYLLDKYPASTAKTVDEAAARQMAIWFFSDGVDPATLTDQNIRDRATALVNEAKQGACPSRRSEPPGLTIEPPRVSAAAGQTLAYRLRASAADAGQAVTIHVDGPAVLLGADQQPQGQAAAVTLDAQGAGQFWVRSSSPGETTISATLPYRLDAGTVFSHIDDRSPTQRLVLAEGQDLVAGASAAVSWAPGAPGAAPSPTPEASPTELPSPTSGPSAPQPTHRPAPSETPATDLTPTPGATAEATATPMATSQGETATPAAAPAGAVAGRPRSLPRTAAVGDRAPTLLLLIVPLLIAVGWRLRRRAAR
ncbi:MAG: Cys-Gln thioester bond-forming surface protein [Kouleothrix sp.]|nr:Cys-Gln thioester bond-forming surface protein [Kouleothrix sp.]